jgi:N-acetylglucosamine malate deacetylase 2
MTRRWFLVGLALAVSAVAEERVLLVVAHPDDEYAFAATVYRITKELHGTVDQVVITNGEAGYRYSQLAEQFYHASLTQEAVGRARLPEIRRRETLAAGQILGIRHHYFLGQKDAKYTLNPEDAFRLWDTGQTVRFLAALMRKEQYGFVFTLLPTRETHGHHRAATMLALQAAQQISTVQRPVVLGGDPAKAGDPLKEIGGSPAFRFDRNASFGLNHSLSYQIVVNWMIAEHKSQGLFQTDCYKHDEERYWILDSGVQMPVDKTRRLFEALAGSADLP